MVQDILLKKIQDRIDQVFIAINDPNSKLLKEAYLKSVIQNDISQIEIIVQTVKQVLQNSDISFKIQFETILFFKDCVDTWNLFLIQRLKQEIIPIYFDILKLSANQSNATDLSATDEKTKGGAIYKNLLGLIQECIFMWSKWFTKDKILSTVFNELVNLGIEFSYNLIYFKEIDILYRDVECIGIKKKLCAEEYIFEDNSIYFEQFICHKQGKLINSKLISRKVSLVDDRLYQIDNKKGISLKKILDFPDFFILQEKQEYLQLKNSKISKQNGIDLKLNWDLPQVEKLEWRLLCKRGNENRCYSIYFKSKEMAIKIKDYIHVTKAKIQINSLKEKMKILASNYRSQIVNEYYQKCIKNDEQSTQGSFQNEIESDLIESKAIKTLATNQL